MPQNPSLSNAAKVLDTQISQNLPAGMTIADVDWFMTSGFAPGTRAKWGRSTFTEVDTNSIADGCSTIDCIYTFQLFHKLSTTSSIRSLALNDMQALKSVFSLKYFDGVTIDNVTSRQVGIDNNIWFQQNLILTVSIRGRI
jgi:hypothetical protein